MTDFKTKIAALDVYGVIADQFSLAIESGRAIAPAPNGRFVAPRNAATGRSYHDVNSLILAARQIEIGSSDPRFCSAKTIKAEGWAPAEKASSEAKATTIFVKTIDLQNRIDGTDIVFADDQKNSIVLLRGVQLYHASQIDGIPPHQPTMQRTARLDGGQVWAEIVHKAGVGGHFNLKGAADLVSLARVSPSLPVFPTEDGVGRNIRAILASAMVARAVGLDATQELRFSSAEVNQILEMINNNPEQAIRISAEAQSAAFNILALSPSALEIMKTERMEAETKAQSMFSLNELDHKGEQQAVRSRAKSGF